MQINSRQILILMNINEQYNQILAPEEFVKSFDSMACFENWCLLGEELDLIEAIKVFESHELYEYCAIMQKVLNSKYGI